MCTECGSSVWVLILSWAWPPASCWGTWGSRRESQVERGEDWVGPCECGGEGVTLEQENGGKSEVGVFGDSCNIAMIAGGCLSSVIATVVGQATWVGEIDREQLDSCEDWLKVVLATIITLTLASLLGLENHLNWFWMATWTGWECLSTSEETEKPPKIVLRSISRGFILLLCFGMNSRISCLELMNLGRVLLWEF